MMHKLRLSCQDVTLSLASSSVGVFTIASSLISITGSIAIQESVLCLFRGIVDSIEESLLSLSLIHHFKMIHSISELQNEQTFLPLQL